MAKDDDGGRRRRGLGCGSLLLIFLFLALTGASYWYVKQTGERQRAVQEGVGASVDTVARTLGGGVDSLFRKVQGTGVGHSASQVVSEVGERVIGAGRVLAEKTGRGRETRSRHVYAGVPAATRAFDHRIKVLENRGYAAGYCEDWRAPAWVSYRLFAMEGALPPASRSAFRVDERTMARVGPEDYEGSGYERGQLASGYAVRACYGDEAYAETFLMSGVVPQKPDMNRRVWRRLESRIADVYRPHLEELWVVAGPVYWEGFQRLESGVQVPNGCFLIVVDEEDGVPRMLGFVVDQSATGRERLQEFLSSVDEIERLTGLDFFPELDDAVEAQAEALEPKLWSVN